MLARISVWVLETLCVNFISPLLLMVLWKRFDKKTNPLENTELLLFFLGLGPAFTVWIVNLLLLLFPKNNVLFYVFMYLVFFFTLFFITYKDSFSRLCQISKGLREILLGKDYKSKIFIFSILGLSLVWFLSILYIPILGHDMFEYATQGRIFFENKAIVYSKHLFDAKSGFYYVGTHGFSFPIFATWEHLVNSLFNIQSDYFFRSITGYYWILIVSLFGFYLFKKDKQLGLLGILVLLLTPGFAGMFFYYHIDTYRIYFLMTTFILLTKIIRNDAIQYLILYGIYGGIMSNAHSISFIFFAIFNMVYFLFSNKKITHRIYNLLIICLFAFLFGAYHYVLDIFWGTGWIFKENLILL